ncbi:uncharacterized protein LOC107800408 [Nicotiana tabacum]|uniref:Transposase-associated domain-containing protein n=2 Tax=Nicotiana TaxID=4085 RepID=A0A1S4AQW3_TOBAC|nr:PREDICTED: uncharacterized protein LOC104218390 [Nicotiana sylvestris]XP_009767176.1 PREDICTED: uncharacterized protein LOC104218390 [Nicotiana sylvestris]XP_009767177.1 PREDICTED: uncharacterized protein LOC104218390 [Nicotiana sylvestris]XP_016479059.1 PREDICTED: uncharacterized protein LOC107800408 [Nicotiana tabacum]XP_016479065.1 PREDICTED: uncharacterized protein LOC107800408 [Nicotiana tabacum]XP_016479074.1 PREDICTED: uncharacterized protein LOC107800408 [Nicotiana tabacum]
MEPEQHRWMYNRNYPNRGGLDVEFIQGVAKFIDYAKPLSQFGDEGTIRCPCGNCKRRKLLKPEIVKFHLYKEGFKEKYHLRTAHEEFEPSVNAHFQNFSDSKVIQWKTSQAKAARASKKDSSLHTEGLVTMRTRRRLVYKRYGSSDEVFPETHAKKKKDGKRVWVESQAEQTYVRMSINKALEYTRSRSINDQDGQRSFNRQSLRFSGASSSSQSSVNQDKPEDELEATRRKLETMQRQLEITQRLLELSQRSLQEKNDDYKRIDKDIKQLKAQVKWMVKSVKNNNIRLPVSRQIDFDNNEPVNDAVPGDNDV